MLLFIGSQGVGAGGKLCGHNLPLNYSTTLPPINLPPSFAETMANIVSKFLGSMKHAKDAKG
jgi:hypothetical protein